MDARAERLVLIYRTALERLLKIISNKVFRGNAVAYEMALIKQIEEEIQKLNIEAHGWAQTEIPQVYYAGTREVDRHLEAAGLLESGGASASGKLMRYAEADGLLATLALLHTEAIKLIVTNTIEALINANNYVGRELRDSIRQAGLEAAAEKFATGATVKQMQKNLEGKITAQGIHTITAKNGRNINVESYAELVARSTTAEATNRATTNQLTGLDYDLVEMTTHFPTCAICAPLQGRVYSISGNDSRFPPLSTAHGGPYANIHPNCRHRLVPWVKDRFGDDESNTAVDEAIKRSNKPFNTDPRSKAEKEKYEGEQRYKAQMRGDRIQFAKYKAVLGEDSPGTFSAFRRIKKNNEERFAEIEKQYRAARREQRKKD